MMAPQDFGIRVEKGAVPAIPHCDNERQDIRCYGEGPASRLDRQASCPHRTARSRNRSLLRSLRGRVLSAYHSPGANPRFPAPDGVNGFRRRKKGHSAEPAAPAREERMTAAVSGLNRR